MTDAPAARRTLADLRAGQSARVTGVDAPDAALRERLLALGMTRGARVRVVRRAATGCPMEVHVRGASLVLRRSEARALQVGDDRSTP